MQRGSTVLESGCYSPNFLACKACGSRQMPKASQVRSEEDEDDDGEVVEETEYEHRCVECGHVVATHWHKFTSGKHSRLWCMECALCGRGADERASLTALAAPCDDLDPASPPRPPAVRAADFGGDANTNALLVKATQFNSPLLESDAIAQDDDDEEWD